MIYHIIHAKDAWSGPFFSITLAHWWTSLVLVAYPFNFGVAGVKVIYFFGCRMHVCCLIFRLNTKYLLDIWYFLYL